MNEEIINILIIKIVKKVNYIKVLEESLSLLKDCYNKKLSAGETSDEIYFFLKSQNLEEGTIESFMNLMNSLISFYPYDSLFAKNLRSMILMIISMKNEASSLLNELSKYMYNSNNPLHQSSYKAFSESINNGIDPYFILLELCKNYETLLSKNISKLIEEDSGRKN